MIGAPPPGVVTGPLPPPPPVTAGRSPFRMPRPRRRPPPPAAPPQRRPPAVGWIALILFFVGLFAVGMGLGVATGFDLGGLFRGPDEPPPRAFPVLEPSRPERLTIPAIEVDAPILEVGLADDGSVDVPPLKRHNEAGWFDGGPTAGQFGPALIVGHADTRTGPSVFHDLGELQAGPGDRGAPGGRHGGGLRGELGGALRQGRSCRCNGSTAITAGRRCG